MILSDLSTLLFRISACAVVAAVFTTGAHGFTPNIPTVDPLIAGAAGGQSPQPIAVAPDSPRWDLEDAAKVSEYQGRKCLRLDGGSAVLKDFELRDGVVDVDVASPASFGFFGFQFRMAHDGADAEEVYLRPQRSGTAEAIQYTPILNTGRNWQLYNGAGFAAGFDIPKGEWFHLRLEVAGSVAKLYAKDMDTPALVMSDLKTGIEKGQLALYVLTGETYFSNFEVRATPDVPWERHWPAMQPGAITRWSISPSLDADQRDLEKPLAAAEAGAIEWRDVEAEPPGLVVLYRYLDAPHLHVTFQYDFSKRLEPQQGMRVVYARTTIDSDRDQVKKLAIGYSDDVSVFLNGEILYRGRSAQGFREPGYLGIVTPDDDAVYLRLKKGRNELLLAVSELGGGWGFICRLEDMKE